MCRDQTTRKLSCRVMQPFCVGVSLIRETLKLNNARKTRLLRLIFPLSQFAVPLSPFSQIVAMDWMLMIRCHAITDRWNCNEICVCPTKQHFFPQHHTSWSEWKQQKKQECAETDICVATEWNGPWLQLLLYFIFWKRKVRLDALRHSIV